MSCRCSRNNICNCIVRCYLTMILENAGQPPQLMEKRSWVVYFRLRFHHHRHIFQFALSIPIMIVEFLYQCLWDNWDSFIAFIFAKNYNTHCTWNPASWAPNTSSLMSSPTISTSEIIEIQNDDNFMWVIVVAGTKILGSFWYCTFVCQHGKLLSW